MAYELKYAPRFIKRLDKIKDKTIIKTILDKAQNLAISHKSGKLLSGKAGKLGIYSLRFGTKYGEMRLLYEIIEKDKVIYLLFVDTREEIYKLLDHWL